jgi:phage tail sheath protein FI
MTTPFLYKRPGVYINETLKPLPEPVTAPGQAIAAFVGTHTVGPTKPVKISSWSQFQALYGGFGDGLNILPFSVYNYFANGGAQTWVLRAAKTGAVAAKATLINVPNPPDLPPDWVQTPVGEAPTGTGTAPPNPIAGLSEKFPAKAKGIWLTWTALPAAAVDAYRVRFFLAGSQTPIQPGDVWVPQVGTTKPEVTFTGLSVATEYRVEIVPFKGTAEGPKQDPVPVFTTGPNNTPVPAMELTAKGEGAYGNQLWVEVTRSWDPADRTRAHVVISYGEAADTARVVETWQDVSLHPADPRYVIGMMNSPTGGSNYVSAKNLLPPATPVAGTSPTPDGSWSLESTQGRDPFAGGKDSDNPDTPAPDLAAALEKGFGSIHDVLLINLCGMTGVNDGVPDKTQIDAAVKWVEKRRRAFMVVDVPNVDRPDTATVVSEYERTLPASTSWAAVYGPWLAVADPAGTSLTSMRLLPAGGAVMGQYALADALVGPNRAAAGVDYPLVGVVGVQHLFTLEQLDRLNERGINVCRPIPQVGFCIMGARTLRMGMPDRYVSVRRMLVFLEDMLERTTRFAIFEPNGPDLWHQITTLVTQQLMTMTQAGRFQSTLPEQAFFVICDESNNPPQTVANGEIHVKVGVALASPAEFIVIDISQYQGGLTASDVAGGNGTQL